MCVREVNPEHVRSGELQTDVKKTARDRVIAMTNGMRDVCTSGFQIKARECREDCGVRAIMRRITEV